MSPSLATNQALDGAVLRADLTGCGGPKHIAAPENRTAATEPLRLGPWLLDSLLAEGTLTRVYRARTIATKGEGQLPAQYVVKVLREVWHDHPVGLARMRQEALVGRCVANRYLAPILSVHVHRPPFYVVLPWLKGVSVAAHLATRGRLEASLALWIARQAAQALEALHAAGYVHGDVNPRNLLLAPDGHVTLLDLSCSHRVGDAPERSDSTLAVRPLLGTPNYLAPEIFIGKQANPRSDLYSLGFTLFEMLAGRLLHMPGEMAALKAFKREGILPSVRAIAPQVPHEVADLVRELTARDPLRRPHSAREVVHRCMRLEIATLRQRVLV